MNGWGPARGALFLAVVVGAIIGALAGHFFSRSQLPEGFARGNGRIEAVEIDVATKAPGRVRELLVDEGDFVHAGQLLANMDTAVLVAQRRQAEAELQRALIGIEVANSQVSCSHHPLRDARASHSLSRCRHGGDLAADRRPGRDRRGPVRLCPGPVPQHHRLNDVRRCKQTHDRHGPPAACASTNEAPMNPRTAPGTIVAATDFSENAEVALAWAAQLAQQHASALVLVHAFPRKPSTLSEFGPLLQTHHEQIRARATAALEREAEPARKAGVRVECELSSGSAFRVVIAAAEQRRAGLIVAGTRGHTSWRRLVLGSTAARLIRHARCPVLTVHPSDSPPRPVRTVLVPTDFSEDAALAVEAATRVLGGIHANRRLVLLHAYDVPYQATYLPAPVLMDAISAVDATVKRAMEKLAAKLRVTGINVDTLACTGYPPRMILDQATAVGADLIAMGTHGRSGMDHLLLGSTAERVLGAASCPVLTVRSARGD